jgi:hypothetical protein
MSDIAIPADGGLTPEWFSSELTMFESLAIRATSALAEVDPEQLLAAPR